MNQKCEELVEFWLAVNVYIDKFERLNKGEPLSDINSSGESSSNHSGVPGSRRLSIFEYDNLGSDQAGGEPRKPGKMGIIQAMTRFIVSDNYQKVAMRKRASSDPKPREEVPVETTLNRVQESTATASSLTMLTSRKMEMSRNMSFSDDVESIVSIYLSPGALKEVNIPSKIVRRLQRDFEHGIRGQTLFQLALDHVEVVLKTNCLPGFLSLAKSLPGGSDLMNRLCRQVSMNMAVSNGIGAPSRLIQK